jgi:hypothetical protein
MLKKNQITKIRKYKFFLVHLELALDKAETRVPGKKKMHFDFGVLEMHLKNA